MNEALIRNNPGALPSPYDYRSAIINHAVASVSVVPTPVTKLSTNVRLGKTQDELQEPACVSHDAAKRMKVWWYLKTGNIVEFSPRWLHILSGLSQYNGGANLDPQDGRNPTTVAMAMKKYGCATIATCPNDTTLPNDQYFSASAITQGALTEALQYKIPGFLTWNYPTQQQIRSNIQTYGTTGLLFRIGREFWTASNGAVSYAQADIDPVRPPTSLADVVSGHMLTGNQFDNDLDHFSNHWGDSTVGVDWAENGESDYIYNEWADYILEAIVIADNIPASALALVQGLPKPGEFKHNFQTNLKMGDTSDGVRALQIALSIQGCFLYPEITGFYGQSTANAVFTFQMSSKITPTSPQNVGPQTRAALNLIYSK